MQRCDQSAEGNLLMGANFRIVESGTSDNRVYYDELQEVCDDIGFLAPKLRSVKVIRTYSGLRVLPEDGLPIVGQTGRYENLWIYEMHSAFSSSPELSWRLAEILCGDMDTEAIETFRSLKGLINNEYIRIYWTDGEPTVKNGMSRHHHLVRKACMQCGLQIWILKCRHVYRRHCMSM